MLNYELKDFHFSLFQKLTSSMTRVTRLKVPVNMTDSQVLWQELAPLLRGCERKGIQ